MQKRNVLLVGAGGQIAYHVIQMLQDSEHIRLTLFLRNPSQLKGIKNKAIQVIKGDVLTKAQLDIVIKGQDIVYANLAGDVESMAKAIVEAMDTHGVKRLIFVTSLGIYNEVPGAFGKWNNQMIGSALKTYRKAADIIEGSNLDYTIVRPAWLTDYDEIAYETTQKEEPFKGTEVSRKSVGAYIADIIQHPHKEIRASIGINKPGTEGDKPLFYE